MTAEGDKSTTTWVGRGALAGEFNAIPATGKKIDYSGLVISRIQKGILIEDREEIDMLGMIRQLGVELKPNEPGKWQRPEYVPNRLDLDRPSKRP